MNGLKLQRGLPHSISRENVYIDVMKLYDDRLDEILKEYPFKFEFANEKGADFGGITRDVYSAFYTEMYSKLFDGTTLVTPAVHPGMDLSLFPVLGAIISHAYLVSGVLPVQIAYPCLAGILCKQSKLPDEILLSTFVESLSVHDRSVVLKALQQGQDGLPSFSSDVLSDLQHILSFYQNREVAHPATLKRLLLRIAHFEFGTKPAAGIQAIRLGIPELHKPFWDAVSASDFYSIYGASAVTTAKVLKMIGDVDTVNLNEERVFSYLRQYIGNMRLDELRDFLRFVTGCSVCTAAGITVNFNALEGFARRPVVHTCSCTLELSTTYENYMEFASDFDTIIKNQEYWQMDAI